MLINAVVGYPEDLKARVKLRAEFIRLQLLDVLAALHSQRNVEVVRQVHAAPRSPDVISCFLPSYPPHLSPTSFFPTPSSATSHAHPCSRLDATLCLERRLSRSVAGGSL